MTCKIITGMQFELIPPTGVTFERAPKASFEVDGVNVEIEDCQIEFSFDPPLASPEEAESVVFNILSTWQYSHGLENNGEKISFKRIKMDIEDLCSIKGRTTGKSAFVALGTSNALPLVDSVKVSVSRGTYSLPDMRIGITTEFKRLYGRYLNCLHGERELLAEGYYIFDYILKAGSKIVGGGHGKRSAKKIFKIDSKVLNELGRLTSKGDPTVARKSNKSGQYEKLSEPEKQWIKKALKIIVTRYAHYCNDPTADFEIITIDYITANPTS